MASRLEKTVGIWACVAISAALWLGGCDKAAPTGTGDESATPKPVTPTPAAKPTTLPVAPAPPDAARPADAPLPNPDVSWITPPTHAEGAATGTFLDRAEGTTLRFVSYNIMWNSIFKEWSPENAPKFVRVMRALNPDVVCLQEIGFRDFLKKENPAARDWSAENCVCLMNAILPLPGGSWYGYRGDTNVILSRWPLKMTADNTDPPGERGQALALVDIPNDVTTADLYVLNNHFKCCGDTANDSKRQEEADSIVCWLRDARTPGGKIDLPARTPFIVAGDLNIVGSFQPVQTMIDGDVQDEQKYGLDTKLDWDDTALTDLHPHHNVDGAEDYTWRNDNDKYDPGRLDYILFTDSVLAPLKSFILDTVALDEATRKATGLEPYDITEDTEGKNYDHLPLVVDFAVKP